MEQFNAFKALKDPAHRGTLRWLKERILEKAKAALGPVLPFVGRDQLLVGKNGWLQDIGAHDPTGVAQGLLSDLLLIDGDGCHNLPLMARRTGIFAWTSLARILRMRHQLTADVEPCWFLFQVMFCRRAG